MRQTYTRPIASVIVAILLASIAPRAFAQTYDLTHSRGVVLAGNSGADPVNTLTLKAPAIGAGNGFTYTFPTLPVSTGLVLTSTTTGGLSWTSIGTNSLTPGAANTFLITNNAGTPAVTWQGLQVTTDFSGNGIGTALSIASAAGPDIVSAINSTGTAGGINGSQVAPTFGTQNLSNSGNAQIGTGASTTNQFGTGASDNNTIGSSTGPSVTTINGTLNTSGNTNLDASPSTGGTINIGNATSTTTFAGTVTFPAGSVTASSVGLANNDVFIGNASNNADTAHVTQDVTLVNSGSHVVTATVNGSHAATFSATGNISATGSVSGAGVTSTSGFTESGGTANINSTGTNNTNINASPATGGTISIGNSTSTTNFAGTVTFPAGSVTASSIGLANNDIFIGNGTTNADTAHVTQDVTFVNSGSHVATATVNGSHATTFSATGNITAVGVTSSSGFTESGGTANINSTGTNNTNINASPATGGTITIGNSTSTTNLGGTVNLTGTVNFTSTPSIPLTTNDLFVGVAGVATPLATGNGGVLNTNSSGVPSITATPTLGVAGSSTGSLSFANSTGGNTTTIQAGPSAPAATYILPTALPTASNQVLTANGTTSPVQLSWSTPSSGTAELFARTTSANNITTTSLSVDPSLQLTLAANSIYEFSGVIAYDGAGTGGTTSSNLNLAMHFATGTLTALRWSADQGGTAVSPASVTTDGTAISSFHVDPVTASNALAINFKGIIVVGGTGGTLQVEEALNSASGNTEILSNSFIRAIKVQ